MALRQPAEVFFDVLEDNPKLAFGFLAFLANQLLDLTAQLARAKEAEEEEE